MRGALHYALRAAIGMTEFMGSPVLAHDEGYFPGRKRVSISIQLWTRRKPVTAMLWGAS